MKKFIFELKKFFDLHVGWFFINGSRQEWYCEELRKKYGDGKEI